MIKFQCNVLKLDEPVPKRISNDLNKNEIIARCRVTGDPSVKSQVVRKDFKNDEQCLHIDVSSPINNIFTLFNSVFLQAKLTNMSIESGQV